MSTRNIFRAADFPATAADTGMEQAAMASVDRIKALEARDTVQYRRRWDAEIEAYIVEPILDPGPNVFRCADFEAQAPVMERAARSLAGDAADARKLELEAETGFEHHRRWDMHIQTYWIERVPFKAPEQPWNMTDNQPQARRPDWDKTPSQFTDFDRMILDAKGLKMLQWLICNDTPRDGRPINAIREALQQGLDAQYGRGHFWAYNHGHRISIQCRYPLGETPSEASIKSRDRLGTGMEMLKGRVFPESTVVLDEKQNVTKEQWDAALRR